MIYNPDLHHRQSIRLRYYDYADAGGYFVTICTHERDCLFGEVVNGEMRLNEAGQAVWDEWHQTEIVRQNLVLDEFVIMPNHFHGILFIDDGVGATRWVARDSPDVATTIGMTDRRVTGLKGTQSRAQMRATHRVAPTGPASGSIGAIIGQFKSIVTKRINALRSNPGCPVWQRNYYEHIIRNEHDLLNIRRYIAENPLKWEQDENNPANFAR